MPGLDDADMRLAPHGGAVVAVLGVPHTAPSWVDGCVSGAREVGATVMAGGPDKNSIDTLARVVFR